MSVCLRLDEPTTKRTSSLLGLGEEEESVVLPFPNITMHSSIVNPKDKVVSIIKDLQGQIRDAVSGDSPWIEAASIQLVDIHFQIFIDDLTRSEEDIVLPSSETMNVARTLVSLIYKSLKELPAPRIDTDYETGDVSIVFRGTDSRMDLIVLNSIKQIQCLYSDSDTTKDISDFAEVITSLKKLAA